jgi:radical SAM superfamily enzyme YgiQ (UPF0313 family)
MSNNEYNGPEIGPIRPPTEADSLLIRVTRNCPWNKCKFCVLYKGSQFSIRHLDHVIEDIDEIAAGRSHYHAPRGFTSVFLQDANSLLCKTDYLLAVLERIKLRFPQIDRITSYARSQTVIDKPAADLQRLREAGLNRIHIGFETGSDKVLEFMNKGATKAKHIEAGLKVKEAGIELSEYYLVGLGGEELSHENALESADALNAINPDFIRVRTLSVAGKSPLGEEVREGNFTPLGDEGMAEELLLFLKNLKTTSYVINNDHIANLLPEASGKLPEQKERMIGAVEWFLNLPDEDRLIYMIGRRLAVMGGRSSFEDPKVRTWVQNFIEENEITRENANQTIRRLMRGYI